MNEPLKILVIVGTVRQKRLGRRVGDWYIAEAQKAAPDVKFEILDAAEPALPLFNEPTPPRVSRYSPGQQVLAEKIGAADGYVVVTAEYNHSVPGSLKNLLDYVAAEWRHKAAAFVGYGSLGAVRSIEHIIQIFSALGVASVSKHVMITSLKEAFADDSPPKKEFITGDVDLQLKELLWWTSALKEAREK